MIAIAHQLVGVPVTYNVTLECSVEAYPSSLNYWARENEQMIYDNAKYRWANYSIWISDIVFFCGFKKSNPKSLHEIVFIHQYEVLFK